MGILATRAMTLSSDVKGFYVIIWVIEYPHIRCQVYVDSSYIYTPLTFTFVVTFVNSYF